jgi:hypothetical protein
MDDSGLRKYGYVFILMLCKQIESVPSYLIENCILTFFKHFPSRLFYTKFSAIFKYFVLHVKTMNGIWGISNLKIGELQKKSNLIKFKTKNNEKMSNRIDFFTFKVSYVNDII